MFNDSFVLLVVSTEVVKVFESSRIANLALASLQILSNRFVIRHWQLIGWRTHRKLPVSK